MTKKREVTVQSRNERKQCVSDGGKLSGGKREMVEITAIVFFFITGFFVFLPSIAKVMGSLAYTIGFVILVSLLITLVWSLVRRR
jgi:hypothetical protein